MFRIAGIKPIRKMTVRRSSLVEGSLLDDEGQTCILGRCAIRARVPKKLLIEHSAPKEFPTSFYKKFRSYFPGLYPKLQKQAITYNDDYEGPERELHLTRLFRRAGVNLRFVGRA